MMRSWTIAAVGAAVVGAALPCAAQTVEVRVKVSPEITR